MDTYGRNSTNFEVFSTVYIGVIFNISGLITVQMAVVRYVKIKLSFYGFINIRIGWILSAVAVYFLYELTLNCVQFCSPGITYYWNSYKQKTWAHSKEPDLAKKISLAICIPFYTICGISILTSALTIYYLYRTSSESDGLLSNDYRYITI